MSNLTFKKIVVDSFAGINSENPIILDFSQFKGKNIARLNGDQGVGKTSFIHALLYAAASNFEFSLDQLVNTKDNGMKGEFEFSKDGKDYRIKFTKSKFELFRVFVEDDGEQLAAQKEPKTMAQKLIGTIGRSPMKLKAEKGEDQVKWLYTMLDVPKEIVEEENKIKGALSKAAESRTESNREYERLKKNLEANSLYLSWEESEEKFKEEKNSETEKKKLDEVVKSRDQLTKAELELLTINSSITTIEGDIADLEQKLESKKQLLAQTKARKENGEKFVQENKHFVEEYKQANESYQNIEKYIAERKQWLDVKEKKAEMDQFQEMVIQFDSRKDELRTQIRNLTLKVLPDIKGLEVVSENSIDGKSAGVYVHGKTIAQLSESELWQFCFLLWTIKKVTMVIIENVADLGSDAITILNDMAKSGVIVWATEMKRGQKYLKIEFVDEIK